MIRRLSLFALVVLGVALISRAYAAWPPPFDDTGVDYKDPVNWPNDPGFAGQWDFWSFVPDKIVNQVDEATKRIGTGGHYDRAWAKTTGDRRILITVLDSGINWNSGDIVNKFYLNPGETPVSSCPAQPGASDHDVNGDGIFNVQDYTTATGHTLATPAMICDSRVTDVNKNGVVDAQDLILSFSDGTDADANGYIDDVSGWDFFKNDNDPMDDTRFGHGTGEANDSAGEANNGNGDAGVCPDCSVMMTRVGDSFVVDGTNFALATIYAVDQGASVIQEALGSLDNSPLSLHAIDYAYNNHVTVIASAADENSFHHNFPGTNNHVIYVHATRYDTEKWENATTFYNFNNCTNYGAQLVLSIGGTGCSSEATGKGAGMAGLIYAAALKANIPNPSPSAGDPNGNRRLTAEEVKQLFVANVDTFYNPDDATDPLKFETKQGWARRFGYGRPNLRSTVDAIFAGKLPPEVDLVAPNHFDVLYPDKTPMVAITGRVGIRGATANPAGVTYDYVVEWAPGVDPNEGDYKQIGKAEMQSSAISGALATWDISGIEINNPITKPTDATFHPDDIAHVHTATIRVRATLRSSDPVLNGLKGEARRGVHIYRDSTLLEAFPINLRASGEASPKIVDLNGDGVREIIVADSAGYVHAFQPDGTELAGWPTRVERLPHLDPTGNRLGKGHTGGAAYSGANPAVSPDVSSPVLSTPAVGDIDGDGQPEVAVSSWHGVIFAFHADGSVAQGFPVDLDRGTATISIDDRHLLEDGVFAATAMADLDGDKQLDIIVAAQDAKLYAFKGDGSRIAGFPVLVQDTSLPEDPMAETERQRCRIMASPAIGDMNKDGVPDIVVATNENYSNTGRLYAVDGRGTNTPGGPFLPGWPINVVSNMVLPNVGEGLPNAPAMADFDGDGVPEVFVAGIASNIRYYGANGKAATGVRLPDNQRAKYGKKSKAQNEISIILISNGTVGDIDDDGVLDVAHGTAGGDAALAFATGGQRRDFEMHTSVWDSKTGAYKPGFPTIIEDWQFFLNPLMVDVDGDGRNDVVNASAGYFIHAWNSDGVEAKGFPKFGGGWFAATPAIADIDGDNKLEMVGITRNGWLFAWHLEGKATGRVDWPSFHHDDQNTGNYETKLPFGKKASPGCSYSASEPATGSSALWLLGTALVALEVLRRRKSANGNA